MFAETILNLFVAATKRRTIPTGNLTLVTKETTCGLTVAQFARKKEKMARRSAGVPRDRSARPSSDRGTEDTMWKDVQPD